MPWVVPIGKTPRRTCMCWQCEQFRLYCATLKANAPAQMVTEEHPLASGSAVLVLNYLLCQKTVDPHAVGRTTSMMSMNETPVA